MSSIRILSLVMTALTTLWTGLAYADVRVSIDPGPGQDVANQLGIDLRELENQLGTELEQAFSLLQPREYLQSLADAQAFSNKGLGVDYASNPTAFVIGGAASVALALGDDGFQEREADQPVGGLAPNISIMAGVNFDFIGLDFLTLYGNFFTRSFTHEQLKLTFRNAGAHLQVKFFRPEGDAMEMLFQWGGFDLTAGYVYSFLRAELEDNLTTQLPLRGPQGTLNATLDSAGILQIDTTAHMIPFEATTNFRVLYVLSLYGGVGFDFQAGGADMRVKLEGDMRSENPLNGQEVDLGTASVEATESAGPSVGKARFLLGAQVNLWFFRLFAQANLMPNKAASLAFGGRLAW